MNLNKDELHRILRRTVLRQSIWLKNRPNILSVKSLAKMNKALKQSAVFGLHMHYAGGTSPDTWAFLDFGPFREYLSLSRPGDLYYAWSLKDLMEKHLILAHGKSSPNTPADSSLISMEDLQPVRRYLNIQYHEIINLYISCDSRTVAVHLGDIDCFEDLEDEIRIHSHPSAEIYILPFTDIDEPEHWLLKAKYPNDKGEVPLGGAY